MGILKGLMSVLVTAACLGMQAQDTLSAHFIDVWYHQGNLVHYLEAVSDHVIYQDVHVGQWSEGDQLIFSIDGNSYRQNRYYLNGFRTNSRFQTGSTLYRPDLEQYGMVVDPRSSTLAFSNREDISDFAAVSINHGGIGGINRFSEWIVRRMHGAGTDDLYKESSVTARQRVRNAGEFNLAKSFAGRDGKSYRQHVKAVFSRREFPDYDQDGLLDGSPLYDSDHYTVQADGLLPAGGLADRLGYLVNISRRDNYGSEFYLNPMETAALDTYGASVYFNEKGLTGGVTWNASLIRHRNLEFSRNVIDQDGESLEPYYPDGDTHELSVPVNWKRSLKPWLTAGYDGFNSLILFRSRVNEFSNDVFMQHMAAKSATPLYRYVWHSSDFAGGILENTLGLEAEHRFLPGLSARVGADVTLDGILLEGKSLVSPGFQSSLAFGWHPADWFKMDMNLSYDRIPYSIETLRYFSDDYLNGTAYYGYGTPEQRVFTTSGGQYHSYADGLRQPSYLTLGIPVRFRFKSENGTHEVYLNQLLRKYYNTWITGFRGGASGAGFMEDGVWFQNCGEKQYIVDNMPDGLMGTGFIMDTPFFVSQLTRYTYTGRRFMCMLSWQSMMGGSTSALGFGPETNDWLCLSESTANPNTFRVLEDQDSEYQSWGRVDQDKAYVLRTYFAWNVSNAFQMGVNFKWTDGQPFSYFNTVMRTDDEGGSQLQILPVCARGINPLDGCFGCRESGIFNFDLHARWQFRLNGHDASLSCMCYNINDFGNVLMEYAFPEGTRGAMSRGQNLSLTVPRGLLLTFKTGI